MSRTGLPPEDAGVQMAEISLFWKSHTAKVERPETVRADWLVCDCGRAELLVPEPPGVEFVFLAPLGVGRAVSGEGGVGFMLLKSSCFICVTEVRLKYPGLFSSTFQLENGLFPA